MHKSQGQTLNKAVIDLGAKEACTGLTFVCLSRAKRISDLIVEPMPFDRLSRLGNSTQLQTRLAEEVRLRECARATLESGGRRPLPIPLPNCFFCNTPRAGKRVADSN